MITENRASPIEGICAHLAPGLYAHPLWRSLVLSTKYQSASCLETSLHYILKRLRHERTQSWPWAHEQDLLVLNIPADPKRLRARGFDHAAFFAKAVRHILVPWADVSHSLAKRRATSSNALLPATAVRRANIHQAFVCDQPITKPVLLVDDVCTTGATLEEGVRALRAAGCPRVYVFTMTMAQETAVSHAYK